MKSQKLTSFRFIFIMGILLSCLVACSTGSEGENITEESTEIDYPTKPITVVVGFEAGGDTDNNARMTAKYLEKELGQPIVVTNITGAGSSVGANEVVNAEPDGYTVFFNHNAILVNTALGLSDVSYEDFKAAGIVASDQTNAVFVHTDSDYHSIEDLIADAEENPGDISVAVAYGTYSHLVASSIAAEGNVEFNIMDVGGGAEQRIALASKRADVVSAPYGIYKDMIEAGEFRAIGLLTDERHPDLPDQPVLNESDINVSMDKDYFFFFPKETPDDIVDIFTNGLKNVVANEEFQQELAQFYITPNYKTPTETLKILEETQQVYNEAAERIKVD